jgi:hypothetical protein
MESCASESVFGIRGWVQDGDAKKIVEQEKFKAIKIFCQNKVAEEVQRRRCKHTTCATGENLYFYQCFASRKPPSGYDLDCA